MGFKIDLSDAGYGGRLGPKLDLDSISILDEISSTVTLLDKMEITGKAVDNDGTLYVKMSEAIRTSMAVIDVISEQRDKSSSNFGPAAVEAAYTQLCLVSLLIDPNKEIPVILSGHDIKRNPDGAMDLILQSKVGFTDRMKSNSSKWLDKFIQAFINLIKQMQIVWKKYVSNYEDTYDSAEQLKASEYNELKSKSSRSYIKARSELLGTRAALTTQMKFMLDSDVKHPDNDDTAAVTMSDTSKLIFEDKPFKAGKGSKWFGAKLAPYSLPWIREAKKELIKLRANPDKDHTIAQIDEKLDHIEEFLIQHQGLDAVMLKDKAQYTTISVSGEILLNKIIGVIDLQSLFDIMGDTQLMRTNAELFVDALKDLDKDVKVGTKDEDIRLYGFTDKTAMALYRDKSGDWTTRRLAADKDIHMKVASKQNYSTNIEETILLARVGRVLFRNFGKVGSNMQKLITNVHAKYKSGDSEYKDIPTIITIARSMYTSLWRDINNVTELCEAALANLVKK